MDVLGMEEATVSLSAHAVRHGLAAVLPAELRLPVYGLAKWSQATTIPIWAWVRPAPGFGLVREDTA